MESRLKELTNNNAAMERKLQQLNTERRVSETPAAFSAKSSKLDLQGQILKFDRVISNQGQGYNPTAGTFTAPSAGRYAFYTDVIASSVDDMCVEICLMKNNELIFKDDTCSYRVLTGSNLALLQLRAGDTVNLQTCSGGMLYIQHGVFSGWRI